MKRACLTAHMDMVELRLHTRKPRLIANTSFTQQEAKMSAEKVQCPSAVIAWMDQKNEILNQFLEITTMKAILTSDNGFCKNVKSL